MIDRLTFPSEEAAFAYFDRLHPVPAVELVGLWKGSEISTGHPFDGVLENLGWYGKRFRADMRADALLFKKDGCSLVPIDPSPVPLGLAFRFHRLGRTEAARTLFSHLIKHLRATGPVASLRMIRFRGEVSAAMVYDSKPVADHFRKIDTDRLIGVMSIQGHDGHFFFQLERVTEPGPSLSNAT
ncbi:DUF4334 domain-containing protein [Sinorhizobium fredii]|jgi:hypothetical protein|uniref:DUF4334 domain-containing protein n=1 Tax=Sinorhizobium fredii (strain USDA 257) TaxID=1185652 RepID=I3X8U7_SINF2|nr:DUF4334 domain-containing protein [Sinorhizobium fredii]AFL52303.1 hypothetical protein USDA257_c37540 [Sinorhizobium fredii USDA 257]